MNSKKVMGGDGNFHKVGGKTAKGRRGSNGRVKPADVPELQSVGSSYAGDRLPSQVSKRSLEEIWDLFWKHHPRRIKGFIEGVERRMIVRALDRVYGNQHAASRLLGIKITTLSAKIKKYGIVLEKRHRPPAGWSSFIR